MQETPTRACCKVRVEARRSPDVVWVRAGLVRIPGLYPDKTGVRSAPGLGPAGRSGAGPAWARRLGPPPQPGPDFETGPGAAAPAEGRWNRHKGVRHAIATESDRRRRRRFHREPR